MEKCVVCGLGLAINLAASVSGVGLACHTPDPAVVSFCTSDSAFRERRTPRGGRVWDRDFKRSPRVPYVRQP